MTNLGATIYIGMQKHYFYSEQTLNDDGCNKHHHEIFGNMLKNSSDM